MRLRFLNPVPIQQIRDRSINEFIERHAPALANLKTELGHTHDRNHTRSKRPSRPSEVAHDQAGAGGSTHGLEEPACPTTNRSHGNARQGGLVG